MTVYRLLSTVAVALLILLIAPAARAQSDRCIAIAQAPPGNGLVHRAAVRLAAREANAARLTFVGHATWLIESPGGIKIATDYNDYVRPPVMPDVATMNRAHTTHYSVLPDPRIKHVLRGWKPEGGGPARHDITVGDVRVRNVATNTRDWAGGVVPHGNSIFIFELAGMCIGHLGHLHHTLSDEQLAAIGQLDVVMVAVDGSYTLDIGGVVETLKTLHARLILPMHYFDEYTLNRFLDRVQGDFGLEMGAGPTITVSQATLPREPKVLVLPGR
ncbi:MAG TPA: MBL fold metallo-hydrolase [Hyphomicrobiaceae bacterium]|nr:MBL fold metallo-hydrolase [Hyphomicrobiaceae bacterium]